MSGAPKECFQSGPALAKAGPVLKHCFVLSFHTFCPLPNCLWCKVVSRQTCSDVRLKADCIQVRRCSKSTVGLFKMVLIKVYWIVQAIRKVKWSSWVTVLRLFFAISTFLCRVTKMYNFQVRFPKHTSDRFCVIVAETCDTKSIMNRPVFLLRNWATF